MSTVVGFDPSFRPSKKSEFLTLSTHLLDPEGKRSSLAGLRGFRSEDDTFLSLPLMGFESLPLFC